MFQNLLGIIENHEDFVFVLDGQTQILEDLKCESPELYERVLRFVRSGNLIVGPVYAQIDWRISPDHAVWKNFSIGVSDTLGLSGELPCGWFMDNFGHISQLPQIMKIFGINCAFLWRGVKMKTGRERMILDWRSPDGSSVLTVFLIGGYRNLYNLRDTVDIALDRLRHEMEKLSYFSEKPLFLDGYDLDVHPEDPRDFLEGVSVSVKDYIEDVSKSVKERVEGEMISGKYASVFPGTLSTRSYLKLEMESVGDLLRSLSVLGADDESYWREYIKTLIHDNICGVGVDQVHNRMEKTYRELFNRLLNRLKDELARFDLDGMYAFSLSAFPYDVWISDDMGTYRLRTDGVGIWRVDDIEEWSESDDTHFENDHYVLLIEDGKILLNDKEIGVLKLERDLGDAYSSDVEDMAFNSRMEILGVSRSRFGLRVRLTRKIESDGIDLRTLEEIFLDSTPLVRWKITLTSRGVGYRFRMGRECDGGTPMVGMPFDTVFRPSEDSELLPERPPHPFDTVLLAAREVGTVRDFPFQDFISVNGCFSMARGLREYSLDGNIVWMTLLRSVEWITGKVRGRTGDAGPNMYVPAARCERTSHYHLAFADLGSDWKRWVELFSKPVYLFRSNGGKRVDVPMFRLDERWSLVEKGRIIFTQGKRICEKRYEIPGRAEKKSDVDILNAPVFPSQDDVSVPNPDEISKMRDRIDDLDVKIERLKREIEELSGLKFHETMHEIYSLEREKLELELSMLLNTVSFNRLEKMETIAEIGEKLNEARRKRRTYDYVLELYRSKEGWR